MALLPSRQVRFQRSGNLTSGFPQFRDLVPLSIRLCAVNYAVRSATLFIRRFPQDTATSTTINSWSLTGAASNNDLMAFTHHMRAGERSRYSWWRLGGWRFGIHPNLWAGMIQNLYFWVNSCLNIGVSITWILGIVITALLICETVA
jgi:hypothetical protein